MKLLATIKLMRMHQYIKNLFIFFPLFFSLQIINIDLLSQTFLAFIAFSLVASGVYILNDCHDIKEDKSHPTKKYRPLASGEVSMLEASIYMGILFTLGFGLMYTISLEATGILFAYLLLNLIYSFYLKHVSIVDIIIIAIGFVLRIFVGTSVTMVTPSVWIVIMTFLLALFLALSKRRDDVLIFNKTGEKMRKSIHGYNLKFIDISMTLMAGVVIVSYLMYCISPETIARMGSDKLYITTLFVILGIMRYIQIVFVEEKSESPTKILLKDRLLQVSILLWILSFSILLYT